MINIWMLPEVPAAERSGHLMKKKIDEKSKITVYLMTLYSLFLSIGKLLFFTLPWVSIIYFRMKNYRIEFKINLDFWDYIYIFYFAYVFFFVPFLVFLMRILGSNAYLLFWYCIVLASSSFVFGFSLFKTFG